MEIRVTIGGRHDAATFSTLFDHIGWTDVGTEAIDRRTNHEAALIQWLRNGRGFGGRQVNGGSCYSYSVADEIADAITAEFGPKFRTFNMFDDKDEVIGQVEATSWKHARHKSALFQDCYYLEEA